MDLVALLLLFVLAIAYLLISSSGAPVARELPASAIILNVVGAVKNPNQSAFDATTAPQIAEYKLGFIRGVRYDADDIDSFPATTVPPPASPGARGNGGYTGPALATVLGDAAAGSYLGVQVIGRKDRKLLSKAEVEQDGWVLARSKDGRPFGEGDRGPLVLVRWDAAAAKAEEAVTGVGTIDVR